jgi:hypothetical protein
MEPEVSLLNDKPTKTKRNKKAKKDTEVTSNQDHGRAVKAEVTR